MSDILTVILDDIHAEYVSTMLENDCSEPYLTAEKLVHQKLYLDTDLLSRIVDQDPSLLAARAGNLIMDDNEAENPAVGAIICCNIIAAALEGLLSIAVEREWLDVDEEGHVLVNPAELEQDVQYRIEVDYSSSDIAKNNLTKTTKSEMSKLFATAEQAYLGRLQNMTVDKDAYQLALEISSDHSVFAPEDIAPLVAENPLLLGLRPDELIDEELFEGDPPSGLIISAHLTRMMLNQLLELAVEQGELMLDSSGHIVMPDEPNQPPTIH